MFKKLLIALIAAAIVALAYCGINKLIPNPPVETGIKKIYITLIDEISDEVLMDKVEFSTDAETLGEFFDEDHEGISIVLGESAFGHSIDAFNGLISNLNNPTGPWIMYSSENNQSCMLNAFCLGIDDLPIYDGDFFVFTYSDISFFE